MTIGLWDTLLALTMTAPLVTALISGLLTQIFITKFGRQRCLIITQVLNIVGSLTIALGGGLSGSYEAIIIGRFVVGFGLGLGLS